MSRRICTAVAFGIALLSTGLPSDRVRAQGQGCDVIVYRDADLKGESWQTDRDQRYLGNHWNDQISSIEVIAGVWAFYWDSNYGGAVMELRPGVYRYVGNHWNDQISSFRCVRPTR
jgi:Beta/Gamma crystallin